MRRLNQYFSSIILFILILNMQLLHAQAKRKDIGKLVFERTCFDVVHYDIQVKLSPNEKFISGSNRIEFKMLENSSKIQLDY